MLNRTRMVSGPRFVSHVETSIHAYESPTRIPNMSIPIYNSPPPSACKVRIAAAFVTAELSQWCGARYARGSAIGARAGR